jgi:hypothetical protein
MESKVEQPTVKELYKAYSEGRQIEFRSNSNLPWVMWELNADTYSVLGDEYWCWRIAEKNTVTKTITYPEPCLVAPERGTTYWYLNTFSVDQFCSNATWNNDSTDVLFLKRGIVHLTEENARLHAQALGWCE